MSRIDAAAPPINFPIISSNGVIDPTSTSLIRLIFSSMTLLRSWGALVMMVMYISASTCDWNAVRARDVHFLRGLDAAISCRLEESTLVDCRLLGEPDHERAIDRRLTEAFVENHGVDRRAQPLRQRIVRRMIRVVTNWRIGSRIENLRRQLDKRKELLFTHAVRQLQPQVFRCAPVGLDLDGNESRSLPRQHGINGRWRGRVVQARHRCQGLGKDAGVVDHRKRSILAVGRVFRRPHEHDRSAHHDGHQDEADEERFAPDERREF